VSGPTDSDIARWYPKLFRTALRLTRSTDRAEEVTQQAFCRALDRWPAPDGPDRPVAWLHRILLNCVRDGQRRRQVRREAPLDAWAVAGTDDAANDGPRHAEQAEQLSRLRTTIRELSEPLRQAFVATMLDGYTYEEAAALLGVPLGTVASRVSAGRKKVAAVMRQTFGEASV